MDNLIARRIEQLCARFTGIHTRLTILDEEPLFLIRRRQEWDEQTGEFRVRLKRSWPLSYSLEEVVPPLFAQAIERKRLEVFETSFGELPAQKIDVTWSGAFIAQVAAILGTEYEKDNWDDMLRNEKVFKPHGQAADLFLAAGAFGWQPFMEVPEGFEKPGRSVGEPELRERLERLVEDVCS